MPVRKDALPPDHVVLIYDKSLAEITAEVSNMAGDYLIVPNMRFRDIEVFQRDIAHNFKGGIIVGIADGFELHEKVRSIADVLIKVLSRDAAPPVGIGEVWARPTGDALEAIPAQDAGPHFEISTAGQISQSKPSALDACGNDIRRIRQFLPLVRQSADDLAARLNPSDNAFTELVRDIAQYRTAISPPESEIAWGLVWGVGVRLEETAAAAEREISNRLAPALEDTGSSAIRHRPPDREAQPSGGGRRYRGPGVFPSGGRGALMARPGPWRGQNSNSVKRLTEVAASQGFPTEAERRGRRTRHLRTPC